MFNKAVLIVSFGSSHDSARDDISKAEQAISLALPDYKTYTAYTSGMIRKALKNREINVMSVEEALEAAIKDGVDKLLVQPTHLLYGDEYEKLCGAVEKKRNSFEKVVIGSPLLADYNDIDEVLKVIDAEVQRENGEGLVLMGHGTGHFCNTVYAAIDFYAKAKGFKNVFVGTVEAWPDVECVIESMKDGGITKCVMLPLMLVAGDHAKNDMAGDEKDSWKSLAESAGIRTRCVLRGLGSMDGICSIYARHALEAAKSI